MKALEQLILSKSRPVQKEAKHIGVSELDKLIMEALLGEAASAGEILEQALVDVWNGEAPSPKIKRFATFAELSADDLQKKIGKPSSAKRVEDASPSKFWREMKGSDTTSKADIKLNDYRISMKMGASAPLFNFGPGDAQACLAAAIVLSKIENVEALNEVKNDLAKLETRIVRGPIRGLKAAVKQQAKIKGLAADEVFSKFTKNYQVDPEAREKVKQDLKDLVAIDTAEKLIEYAEKILPETQDNLDAIGDKLFKALDPSTNPILQQKFYGEALTGRVKFDGLHGKADKDQVAQWMFMTSGKGSIENLPQGTNVASLYDFYEIDDQFVNFISKAAKFRARFKSDSVKRSFAGKQKKTGFYKIRAIITAEIKKSVGELKKMKAELNEMLASKKQLQEVLLKEGLLDKAKMLLKKLLEGAEQIFNKVVSFFKESVTKIVDQTQVAIEQARNLLDNSASVADLAKNMGISLEEYVNSFEGLQDINNIKVKDVI